MKKKEKLTNVNPMGLDSYQKLTDQDLVNVNGGTILGTIAGYIVGKGGKEWGKMHKHNPGMPQSALYG